MTDEGAKASTETEPTAATDRAEPQAASEAQTDSSTDSGRHERTSPWYRRVEIVTAFIALFGVMLAGGVGACSSYVTTTATMEGQRNLAREGFGRDHREKAYDELLTQLSALDSTYREVIFETASAVATVNMQQGISGATGLTPQQRDSVIMRFGERWSGAQKQYDSAISAVELVASRRVVSVAGALAQAYNLGYLKIAYGESALVDVSEVLKGLGNGINGPKDLGIEPPPIDPTLEAKSINELRALLVQYAKEDLGLTD
ncbi:hypothetical protein [Mycolicibacterium fortuitum]|uniref:hypothetical protein n=1 Tax=Mycolicibacterium fortuitum TaxID=1766 RepID=UPI0007EA50A8|nr:hypothetical protein [Mycolicibacterium fortuitum]OBG50465.1 hypothetical protein A5670_25675 [Mycolicibacterium fortuitum]